MKKMLLIVISVIIITMGIPLLVVSTYKEKKVETEPTPEKEKINVYVHTQDKVIEMDTIQYLKEVVSAEMPANFHEEALKAQAVAARTYMLTRKNEGPTDIHKGADICTDSTHCKAWMSEADRKKAWGQYAEKNWHKISDAVESTNDMVITYQGNLISAVFHSTSSGTTENAKDVWGGDVPYLVSVSSPGDTESPKYNSNAEFNIDEYKKICEENIPGINWENGLFCNIERSTAGGITLINIGGITVKGVDFRKMFSLQSTNIDIKEENGKVIMTVKGYGHGVGMSQYGANYLANEGKNYIEILKTYYTGVEVEKINNISN